MATYEVELTPRARKQYKALDPTVRARIRAALHKLADDPSPATVTALSGSADLLRIRVGDWRIIYRIERDVPWPHQIIVLVVDIGHRSKVYRRA